MGRKRKNAVYAYFSYSKESNVSNCLVTGCSAVIKGTHGTNLMYHLSSSHPTEHKIVTERNRLMTDVTNKDVIEGASTSTSGDTAPYGNIINYLKTQCINLVTVHGRPFSMMDDLAFRNIISLTSVTQREAQSLNSHSIKQFISQAAEEKRAKIAASIKEKTISIKVDSATRFNRTYFAVNAQYIIDGCIHIKQLGVVDLYTRSAADFLKEKLLCIFRKYNIRTEQIYSITTDNGENMVKMVRLFSDELNDSDSDEEYEIEPEISLQLDTEDIDQVYCITSVRCVAHALQLAVNDALIADHESKTIIQDARDMVRTLRSPKMKNLIQMANKKEAVLGEPTRWESILDMIEGLLELREYFSTGPGKPSNICESIWIAFQDLVKSLKPSKILTKLLQEEQLTIGDFYYHWARCHLETSHVQVPLAQLIYRNMKTREQQLKRNPTFVSALYLDPRFQVVLSEEEELLAKKHLHETWWKIIKLEADVMTEIDDTQQCSIVTDEIEAILFDTEITKRCRQHEQYIETLGHNNITEMIENFSGHPRILPKANILAFWKSKQLSEPHLYRLASTVLATPATQVSVQRLYSSLKCIVNDLRYNFSSSIVEDILILRNNN